MKKITLEKIILDATYMYTSEEVLDAVIRSRDHWENDICKPLREGRKCYREGVILTTLVRWDDGDNLVLPCYSESCPLCQLFEGREDECEPICPLSLIGHYCNDMYSVWYKFIINPCLETAEAMRDTLQRIIDRGIKVGC